MNEDILYCNPKTDHLEPKSVLPIFESYIDEMQRLSLIHI